MIVYANILLAHTIINTIIWFSNVDVSFYRIGTVLVSFIYLFTRRGSNGLYLGYAR